MRISAYLAAFMLFGCAKQPEGNGTDAILKEVVVPGHQTERSVLYGSPSNEDCVAVAERVAEVLKAPESDAPIGGFYSRDVEGRLSSFRAYFLPGQLATSNDAAFLFCQGKGAALVPAQCSLLGSTSRGCFQTGIYGIADVEGISATVDAIREQWPEQFSNENK